jgi:CDGSH-type Zn-finger protein
MGAMVIACYKPKPGRDGDVLQLVRRHLPTLVREGLAEDRPGTVGRATDGTLIEIFVWKSREASEAAHANKAVMALWKEFGEASDLVVVTDIAEMHAMFPHLEHIPLDPPKLAGKTPMPVEVEAGKTYFWCSCGKSATQPFCDGSHKGSTFTPVKWTAIQSRKVFFCACKRTGGAPLCDGTHSAL